LTVRRSIATFKQAGQQFIADDCMGLAQQVAYSSLLAFFPAVAFLLGLLGTVHLYDESTAFWRPWRRTA
jgi:Predicted membrane protein